MKQKYLTIIPAILAMAPMHASAQITLEPSLTKVAQKVDTDGTYLQLNKFDGDIKALTEYGELGLDIAKQHIKEIPADTSIAKLSKLIGIDAMKASAMSSKKEAGAWNNKAYIYTGGSNAGILSMYGKTNADYIVTGFAPETTDIAIQLTLDLRKAEEIISGFGAAFGQTADINQVMDKKLPMLGNKTAFELISKLNFNVNIALDINSDKRLPIPMPVEGFAAPSTDILVRIDGIAWAWDLFGDKLISQTGLPWKKSKKKTSITYTLPAEMKDALMGYNPVIRVDKTKNHIWISSKVATVKDALNPNNKKLKDNANFKNTMSSLPSKGNSLIYISKDILDELVNQYKQAGKKGLLDDPDFKKAKPLVDRLIKDLTSPDSGIAMTLSKDDLGILSVIRAPFPTKNYLNQLSPMISQAITSALLLKGIEN